MKGDSPFATSISPELLVCGLSEEPNILQGRMEMGRIIFILSSQSVSVIQDMYMVLLSHHTAPHRTTHTQASFVKQTHLTAFVLTCSCPALFPDV